MASLSTVTPFLYLPALPRQSVRLSAGLAYPCEEGSGSGGPVAALELPRAMGQRGV